ncbi:hypothetical protein HUN08_11635 [Gordonia sp. X0973]|uniref:hypothetical protein n=1 Tax=Gordonia sp. X0973 TaxID=2742602 RepID=UPI000F522878|nr:hypothetical protein [Gordonia sp. X0973]QKT07767.1 hypothetical protein HUN08_11635 [Gordonia sp. X0973]
MMVDRDQFRVDIDGNQFEAAWHALPSAIRRWDAEPHTPCEEGAVTMIVWAAIDHVPGVAEELEIPAGTTLYRGGHGDGDLRSEDRLWHLEIKSHYSKISEGEKCPSKCGVLKSQFEHMLETEGANVRLLCPTRRVEHFRRQVSGVSIMSFSDFASLVEASLASGGAPSLSPFACVLAVEYQVS